MGILQIRALKSLVRYRRAVPRLLGLAYDRAPRQEYINHLRAVAVDARDVARVSRTHKWVGAASPP